MPAFETARGLATTNLSTRTESARAFDSRFIHLRVSPMKSRPRRPRFVPWGERLEARHLLSATGSTGEGQPVDNVQPSLGMRYVIALNGIFPSPSSVSPLPTGANRGPTVESPTHVGDRSWNQLSPQSAGLSSSPLIGTIALFAGNFAPRGWAFADGQLLSISSHTALFSIIGTIYGGNGETTFALPDLSGRTVVHPGSGAGLTSRNLGQQFGQETVTLTEETIPAHSHALPAGLTGMTGQTGGGLAHTNVQPSLGVNYIISLQGLNPSPNGPAGESPSSQDVGTSSGEGPFLGEVAMFAGNFAPHGWALANGQTLAINQNPELFSLLGTTYGGDGMTTFALPDLRGRTVVHPGTGPGLTSRAWGEQFGQEEVTLAEETIPAHSHTLPAELPVTGDTGETGGGQAYTNMQPSLGVHYMIALVGLYPSRSQPFDEPPAEAHDVGTNSTGEPLLGGLSLFAGNFAPQGWALADGQTLSIAQNSALFSLLGTSYGGDGETTFSLPDLRGRSVVHAAQSNQVGEKTGSETTTLTVEQLPAHSHELSLSSPEIAGTVAGQAVNDNESIQPFAAVTITDIDGGPLDVTVTLSDATHGTLTGGGFTEAGSGVYQFAAESPAAAQDALRQLTFDPTENQVPPGSSVETSFTLQVDDRLTTPAVDTTTSVIATSINLAPANTVNLIDVGVDEGSTALNSGHFSDPDGDAIELAASVGTVVDNGNGTWSWTFFAGDGPNDSQSVTVSATDQVGATTAVSFPLTVNNVPPQFEVDSVDPTFELIENTPAGEFVGLLSAQDPAGPRDLLIYNVLGGTGAGQFVVDATTGAITVASLADLDFENQSVFNLLVQVTDGDGGSAMTDVTLRLLNQASIQGRVFLDVDLDSIFDSTDMALEGVVVELIDSSGLIQSTTTTDQAGSYIFEDIDPDEYMVRQIQPTGTSDGPELLGSLGGSIPANDTMQLTLERVDATDYLFAEHGQSVGAGDTAGTGFWQSRQGRQIIIEGGAGLGSWLTENFYNIFGSLFANASGQDIADFYKERVFRRRGSLRTGLGHVDAQFMAAAFATYFTSRNLAGDGVADQLNVTDLGIGFKVVNVGTRGAAFNVANHTNITVMQALRATNTLTDPNHNRSWFTYIYDTNGNGIIDPAERALRSLAGSLYRQINAQGTSAFVYLDEPWPWWSRFSGHPSSYKYVWNQAPWPGM